MEDEMEDAGGVNEMKAELAALRKENAQMANKLDEVHKEMKEMANTPERTQTQQRSRSDNNKTVRRRRFSLGIGPGASNAPRFHDDWVTFLQSGQGAKPVREGIARGIIRTINFEGRDLTPNDTLLCIESINAANQAGKATPVGGARIPPHGLSDDDESDDERSDTAEDDLDPAAAKAARKKKAAQAAQRALDRRRQAVTEAWDAMDQEEQDTFISDFLQPSEPIEIQLRKMTQKGRSIDLYPALKGKLRSAAPWLYPETGNIKEDKAVYKESKKVLPTYESREHKWPRVCKMLFTVEDDGAAWFFDEPEDSEDEVHPFTAYVYAIAQWARIDRQDIEPPLIAFLAYIVNQILHVAPRNKGKALVGELVRSDLECHNKWNAGISKALKFMADRKDCPTRNPKISAIQKTKKAKKK